MTIEERAQQIADAAVLSASGPQTVPSILADYQRRLKEERALIAESHAQFEAGEILEEELYESDAMGLATLAGGYPLLMEARVVGRRYAAFVPAPVKKLQDDPSTLESYYLPLVREHLRRRIVIDLTEKREKKGALV